MDEIELASTAKDLVAPGKGILASDESFPTIEKRFSKLGIPSTEETRRAYRELLYTTPGVEEFISGAIMFDETIRQSTKGGIPFPQVLDSNGIIPGIKVDEGTEQFQGSEIEKVTKGVERLPTRFPEYIKLGALFSKFREVFTIGPDVPSEPCIQENAKRMAEYAYLSQEAGLVPIVEPEVLMDGDHTIQKHAEVTLQVLEAIFARLKARGVKFEYMLLKPNMVLPGKDSPNQLDDNAIAEETLRVLRSVVPTQIPGIVFLSGGQTPDQSSSRLNAMNRIGNAPWQLSFSYGRALQDPVMATWGGKEENVEAAQKQFYKRAKLNSVARYGNYKKEMENEL